MKTSSTLLAAALLSAAAFGASANEVDFRDAPFQGTLTRAQVQAELAATRGAPNTYSIRYNQLDNFRSERTRAEVQAEYLANRDLAAALTSQDSGSAWLAAHPASDAANTRLAGTPATAQ